MLVVMALFLFVVVPVAMGYLLPGAAARVAWLVFGGVLALAQARDEDLGGAWVLVALAVLLGLAFVALGRRAAARENRT